VRSRGRSHSARATVRGVPGTPHIARGHALYRVRVYCMYITYCVCCVQAVNGLTINVRKMFLEMDQQLYEECQAAFVEEEGRAREVEEQREATWRRLECAAQGKAPAGTIAGTPADAASAAAPAAPRLRGEETAVMS